LYDYTSPSHKLKIKRLSTFESPISGKGGGCNEEEEEEEEEEEKKKKEEEVYLVA
jgi:hypothetical protein